MVEQVSQFAIPQPVPQKMRSQLVRVLNIAFVMTLAAVAIFAYRSLSESHRETSQPTSRQVLAPLQIDNARTLRQGYSRDLFPQWLDLDGDGCNARNQTLRDESLVPVETKNQCTIVSGSWISLYDNKQTQRASELDIDHVVPLANAWQSGAWRWSADRRAAFANATDEPDHLIAVTREINREKGDQAPDVWRPPYRGSWCRYATAWTKVKIHWELTATTTERDALDAMLDTCAHTRPSP